MMDEFMKSLDIHQLARLEGAVKTARLERMNVDFLSPQEQQAYVRERSIIPCIKLVRERTGLSLLAAKLWVESIPQKLPDVHQMRIAWQEHPGL